MPTAPTILAAYQADLTPLQGRWGRAWALSVGASKDVTIERARQAALAGAVSRAPDDALVYLGADVALERLPGEPDARYRARIAAAWGTWPWAGTATALVTVFAQVSDGKNTRSQSFTLRVFAEAAANQPKVLVSTTPSTVTGAISAWARAMEATSGRVKSVNACAKPSTASR